jgi:hypothetical protein
MTSALCSGTCPEGQYSEKGSTRCFNVTFSGTTALQGVDLAKQTSALRKQLSDLRHKLAVNHRHQRRNDLAMTVPNNTVPNSRGAPSFDFNAPTNSLQASSVEQAVHSTDDGQSTMQGGTGGGDRTSGTTKKAGSSCKYGKKTVPEQWVGADEGSMWCNQCLCAGGKLVCTQKDCGAQQSASPPAAVAPLVPMPSPLAQGGEAVPGPHQCLHHKNVVVANGWVGAGLGSNWCNMCICQGGQRAVELDQLMDVTTCSMNACRGLEPTPAPTPSLNWDSMCKHGGKYVANGWSGQGVEDQWCNHCLCSATIVSCTTLECGVNPDDCIDDSLDMEHSYHDGWTGKAAAGSTHWCTQCMCVKGAFACAPISCGINPAMPTSAPTIDPMSCIFNHKLVRDGWFGDGVGDEFCNTCECKKGRIYCTNEVCRRKCRNVQCPNAGTKPVCQTLDIVRKELKWHGCCFNPAHDCLRARQFKMVESDVGGYWGMAPYLAGDGQTNRQRSEKECRNQCLGMDDCLVGTFVPTETAVKGSTDGVIGGECWLASHVHANLHNCDKLCKSFKKVPFELSTPTEQRAASSGMPSVCQCDPAQHPSKSTTCTYDLIRSKIVIHYLDKEGQPVTDAAYKQAHRDETHLCKVVGRHCQCCSCAAAAAGNHQEEDNSSSGVEAGSGGGNLSSGADTQSSVQPQHQVLAIRTVMAGWYEGAAPYLAGGGSSNVQLSLAACEQQCAGMKECLVGSFTTSGTATGECWLSHHIQEPSACSMPCTSFAKWKHQGAGGSGP